MSIKNIIKKWLGLQADIDQAVKETREQVTKQLTSEKEAAIAQLSRQHGEEVAQLKKQMANAQEQAEKERKQFTDLQARLDKYRQVADKMKVQHSGPGRPTVDRVRFNLQLDKPLKETIAILESAGVIKRGAVTEHIHADLYRWLTPLREELERTLPFEATEATTTVITAE